MAFVKLLFEKERVRVRFLQVGLINFYRFRCTG